jgi:hypothetical protein
VDLSIDRKPSRFITLRSGGKGRTLRQTGVVKRGPARPGDGFPSINIRTGSEGKNHFRRKE